LQTLQFDVRLYAMIQNTRIVAGATGYGAWPDNSLEGARHCLDAPVDGIEIDVQMTKDGVVVAQHDTRLARGSCRLDGQWLDQPSLPIKSMTFAELQRFDLGRFRPGSTSLARYPDRAQLDGVRVPSLRALLSLLNDAAGAKRLLYVEIKTNPQDPLEASDAETLTKLVIDEIERAHYEASSKIIAFDWKVLRLAQDRLGGIATAHLTVPHTLRNQIVLLPDGSSHFTDGFDPVRFDGSVFAAIKAHGGQEWSPYFTEVDAHSVAQARQWDLKVGPWGLSKSADIQSMIALDVFSATVSGPAWS